MAAHTLVTRGVLQPPDCHGRPVCDPTPVCPACGGLECLCRPRFFAGQLLTEDDLNLLDRYLQGKNRLHNRHLHGWGVVCGLEVVCGVCGPNRGDVVVKPGYALSPCGNDIVVCKSETVDICDLINRCRPPVDDCRDPFIPPRHDHPPATPGIPATPGAPTPAGVPPAAAAPEPSGCSEGEQWVLAVCYLEKPTRGMAALHSSVDTGCGCHHHASAGCGCGGTGGTGGCGCGGGHKGSSNGKHGKGGRGPTKHVPDTCEPTVVCEGYKFVVYKAAKRDRERESAFGAMARRFICCILPFIEAFDAAKPGATPAEAAEWVASFYDTVYHFVVEEGLYDCTIAQKLAVVSIPSVVGQPDEEALATLNQAAAAISGIAYLVFQKCFCAALLPPCPEPAFSDCVPLATVTVARGDCRVTRVCNISARKFLVTWPNLAYWLSFAADTAGQTLRKILEDFCCTTDRRVKTLFDNAVFFKPADEEPQPDVAPRVARARTNGRVFSSLLAEAIANRERQAGPEHVLLGALDARDAEGRRFATDRELAHPTEFIVAHKIAAPLIRALVPEEDIAHAVTAAVALARPADERVSEVERQLANLKQTVADQAKQIKALKTKR